MDSRESTSTVQSSAPENTIDIAGYIAIRDPWCLTGWASSEKRTKDQADAASLEKLHRIGMDVNSLDEAHERYKISPLRMSGNIREILSFETNPVDHQTKRPAFNDKLTTALAIQYPNHARKGEVLPHTQMIRVRYPQPRSAGINGEIRYEQPHWDKQGKRSLSEPYFLPAGDMWERIYDSARPLIIAESELKAACLNLAGFAAVGFGGVEMWRAPKKSGKSKIHFALDPEGPRRGHTIPILDREIFILPDTDYRSNHRVRNAVRELAKALMLVGVPNVKVIHLPIPSASERVQWKDIDELLYAKFGPRWSRDENTVINVYDLVHTYCQAAEVLRSTDRYMGTDVVRGVDRVIAKMTKAGKYTAVAQSVDYVGEVSEIGWLSYDPMPAR